MHSSELFHTLLRYFSVSAGVYVLILAGMYGLVDGLGLDRTSSYVLVYLIAYAAEYTLTLLFVFKKEHAWHKVLRFIANTLAFLLAGSLLFKGLLQLQLHYLVATIAVAAGLLPFRYWSNKYFVYA
ncbi:GtrA family protein [Pseudorhodoferax sp.]|uniref:GtrA family protein n=1 Tax=Pseudorhodoferax sp. TaxID=1993553 RepID=UPI002DD639DF|nr:GtrA family protein [Pseudorhodoferax sp.]